MKYRTRKKLRTAFAPDASVNALHLLQQGHFRVHFLGDFLHPSVVFLDALVQRFDFFEQRLQNIPQFCAQCSGQLPVHLIRATLGQSLAIRLHEPPCCVHQGVRALTSSARARITVRWSCACTLRCHTGPNSAGSIRASRASLRTSCRSSFRLLLVISCTFCACATIASCPNSLSSRLTRHRPSHPSSHLRNGVVSQRSRGRCPLAPRG
jgi:hypothetical protein